MSSSTRGSRGFAGGRKKGYCADLGGGSTHWIDGREDAVARLPPTGPRCWGGVSRSLIDPTALEKAAAMANHASTRTTQLYDRHRDEVSLDEVERIVI
jgi:hypothetical protein